MTTNPNDPSHEIDWAVVEANLGYTIGPEERHRIELAVLCDETTALVSRADRIQHTTEIIRDEIAAAHDNGLTHEQYLAALQGGQGG